MKFTKEEIYDRFVPALCPQYNSALNYFRDRTRNADSVVELGIGTGNIAKAILNNNPRISYAGFDFCSESLEKAKQKLEGYNLSLTQTDFSKVSLPKVDFIVSSLSIHHLKHEEQAKLFYEIKNSSNNFLHFELIAPKTKNEEETNNKYINNHVAKVAGSLGLSCSDIQLMIEESNKQDHPLTMEEHFKIHEKYGLELEILILDHCFVMYQTHKK